ncbi:hypothetical protein EKS29_15755 [Acinetobacter baumannii]|nr:hypothetical protein CAT00_08175 [Acinetobacter pittii]RTY06895.1 hypothetical protein EKS29_15755 [Acinetobacter baumannii]TPT19842.1 hypothetical protein FJU72_17670 [Acinetobacter baumannii]HAV5689518.1 hypothetical protein [Acinetobacter baumannii]HAV5689938.1 hypothetical protein [Acinetobacter baumannii]
MFLLYGILALIAQAFLIYFPFKIKWFFPNVPSIFHGFFFRYILLISLQILLYKILGLSGFINYFQELLIEKYI